MSRAVPSYVQRMHSTARSGGLKPWAVPYPTDTTFFSSHTYLWWSLLYKLGTSKRLTTKTNNKRVIITIYYNTSYVNVVFLSKNNFLYVLTILVIMWDDKMPTWWDGVRGMTQAQWHSVRQQVTFWQHVRRRVICFWTLTDHGQLKLQKAKPQMGVGGAGDITYLLSLIKC